MLRDGQGRILPGQRSINPHGRPRNAYSPTVQLREKYGQMTPDQLRQLKINQLPALDAGIVRELLESVRPKGATAQRARQHIFDRLDGKPRQSLDVNTDAQERTDDILDKLTAWVDGAAEDDDADDDADQTSPQE